MVGALVTSHRRSPAQLASRVVRGRATPVETEVLGHRANAGTGISGEVEGFDQLPGAQVAEGRRDGPGGIVRFGLGCYSIHEVTP